MRRIKLFLVSCMFVLLCAFGFAACNKGGEVKATLLSATDTQVVIRIDETDGKGTLGNAMEQLKQEGAWTYTASGGMLLSINGKENAADYSSCWMLYTSDSEMSNTEWGTIEYDGAILGSAVVGYSSLTVIKDGIYVWIYQGF